MSVASKSSRAPGSQRWYSLRAQEARLAWLLVLPTALIVFGLVLFPAIFSIWISFRDVGLGNLNDVFRAPFVGLENYRRVIDDFAFKWQGLQSWGAAVTSIVYSFGSTVLTLVVGLIAYGFFTHRAPLGFLDLLFRPTAVIIGEFILSLPIIANLTVSAVQAVDSRAMLTAKTLGAGKAMTAWTILLEARFSLLAAIIAGFGRAISEVGSAMMLGGNIRFYTQTMTTAIALETSKGEFGFGLALGFFLLLVVFTINIFFHLLQVRGRRS